MNAPAPQYSRSHDLANSIIHGVGTVLAVAGLVLLVVFASLRATAWHIVSCSIYGTTLVLLYTSSTLYHSFRSPRVKKVLRSIDHASIYLLIAGSYTPFTLGVMRGTWGWTLFGIVWGLAAVGILAKTTLGVRFHLASTLMYLAMGWIGVVAARPLMHALTSHEIAWIIAGGLAYTAGVPFYLWKSRRYTHAAWHVFVLAGVACHFVAVLSVMSPGSA